jgi:hypothetical protein
MFNLVRVSVTLIIMLLTIPGVCQRAILFSRVGYGYSILAINTNEVYRLVCPEVKLGLDLNVEWNRVGINAGILPGIRLSAESSKNYLLQAPPTDDLIFIKRMNESYSSNQSFVEVPVTGYMYFVKKKLSFHAGFYARKHLTPDPRKLGNADFVMGGVTMLRFKPSKKVNFSLDYFLAFGKTNSTYVVTSAKLYYLRSSSVNLSVYFRPFDPK